jgi:hypothetical protein
MQLTQSLMSQPWILIVMAMAFVVAVSIFTEQISDGLSYIIFGALRRGKSIGYLVLIGIPLLIFVSVGIWAWHVIHAALLH